VEGGDNRSTPFVACRAILMINERKRLDQSVLFTDRLLLRRYLPTDIPALVSLIGAREVAETTLRIPHPYTAEDARELLRQVKNEKTFTRFAIVLRETQELCGGLGLNLEPAHDRAEVGYWVGVPHWGQGYATEAAREAVRFGFAQLRLNRIYASCFVGNRASQRVLEKIGFEYEGRLRQHVKKWNDYRDLDYFGLLATNWRRSQP
jgi:[ribosomal protein S5]-alanine N-acetyltransferase